MNTITLEAQINKQKEYDKNLESLIGYGTSAIDNISKYAGILKNRIDSVKYQRSARAGWDSRITKLQKK